MSCNERYQGYTNHETWAVALWIDNDAGLYEERRCIVRDNLDDLRIKFPDCGPDESVALADALKDWVTEMAPDLGATLWSDLINAALSEVNWLELAEMWIAEERENAS